MFYTTCFRTFVTTGTSGCKLAVEISLKFMHRAHSEHSVNNKGMLSYACSHKSNQVTPEFERSRDTEMVLMS